MDAEQTRLIIEHVYKGSGVPYTTEEIDDVIKKLSTPQLTQKEIKYKSCFEFMEMEYGGLVLTPEKARKLRREKGSTPLIRACMHGCLDIVIKLLDEYHVDIEEMGSVRDTYLYRKRKLKEPPDLVRPLYIAVYARQAKIIKALIDRKASVNATSAEGETALHAACYANDMGVVEYLVSHGADLQLADDNDLTCIMHAAKGHGIGVAKYLAKKGQNVNQRNRHDLCALDFKAKCRSNGFEYFISCCNEESFFKALEIAATFKNGRFVYCAIEQKYCSVLHQVNALLLLGSSFIDFSEEFFFSRRKHLERCTGIFNIAVGLRLKDIKNYNKCKEDEVGEKFTALPTKEMETFEDVRMLNEDLHLILKQCLLIQGRILGPDSATFFRTYTVYTGSFKNPAECLHLNIYALLKLYDKLETQHKFYSDYFTSLVNTLDTISLDIAVPYTKELIMIFSNAVLRLDSSLLQRNKNAEIMENFSTNVLRLLLFIQFFVASRQYIPKLKMQRIKILVERFIKWRPSCCNGRSPLHYVFLENSFNSDLFKFLLRRGADINAVDNHKNTPLHVLAKNPNSKIPVSLLLKYGAHIDARNANKETAMQLMCSETLLSIDTFQYVNLKCLCSCVLKDSGAPFLDLLPKSLQDYVDFH